MTNEEQRSLDLHYLSQQLSTDQGRHFMWRCLENTCIFKHVYSRGSDTHEHAFREGKRSHGIWLDSDLREASLDNYLLMLREHDDER